MDVDFEADGQIKEKLPNREKFDKRLRILGVVFMDFETLINFFDQEDKIRRAWLKAIECQKTGGDFEFGPGRLGTGLFDQRSDGGEQLLCD